MIRVAVVDDHSVFREALRSLLEAQADIQVVAEAGDATSACEALERERPDVAVIDVGLPGSSGISVLREANRRQLGVRGLVLTANTSEETVAEALLAGAQGLALKTQPASEVVGAIRTINAGEEYIAPEIPRSLIVQIRRSSRMPGPLEQLSPREREIFTLIVASRSNREIASELRISVKTVETHRASINRKLSVHSTAELVRFAALHGLLRA